MNRKNINNNFSYINTRMVSSIVISSLLIFIVITIFAFDKRKVGIDEGQHFYDMKRIYESGKLPVYGARFIASGIISDENATAHVPGGAYYFFYTIFYKLSNESLRGARLLNALFNIVILFSFLIWVYKRFDVIVFALLSALVLINGYTISAVTNFWNPNITLIFSFLLFMTLYEYINEEKKINTILGAIFSFPILAVMAQAHFVTFFSMVPTIIVYLIITYKKTKKYLPYWALGVFISFMLYMPYLISEFQNGFNNTKLILSTRSSLKALAFLQMHALILFPTNEMSIFYGSNSTAILRFWTTPYLYVYGLVFLFLSVSISVFAFFRSLIFTLKKKNDDTISKDLKTLKEMLKIYFLFIPVAIIVNIAVKSKPGTFHYLYSAFAFSFLPIIFLIKRYENIFINSQGGGIGFVKNKDAFAILFLYISLNIFSMMGQLLRYYKMYEEPLNEKAMNMVAKSIYEDSKGSRVKVYSVYNFDDYRYRDFAVAYFPEYVFSQEQNDDTITNRYLVLDMVNALRSPDDVLDVNEKIINERAKLIAKNKGLKVYKLNNTNAIELLDYKKRVNIYK